MKKSLGDIVGGFPGGRTRPRVAARAAVTLLFVMNGFTRPQIIAVFIFRTAALLVIQFNGAGIWIPDPPSLLLLLLLRRPHPSTVSRLASPSVIRAFTTLNDKECQRLRNADVSVSKPTALPSFDGNSHFRDRDWRITNRFRDFELGNFLGDFWMIKYIFSWWQKESRCLFLDREWRVTNRWGFFGNLGDFHRKFHFWVKCTENIWFDFSVGRISGEKTEC